VDNVSEMLAQVRDARPDVVCISALPSFAVPHVRSLYAKLRAQQPDLRILVGLWHFSGDRSKISRRLALTDGSQAFITLGEFIEQLKAAPTADPVPANAS
jgi:hypothetical protein